jgi:hypothetical protein
MQAAIAETDLLRKRFQDSDPERRPVPTYARKDYEKSNRGTLVAGSGGYSVLRDQIRKPLAVQSFLYGLTPQDPASIALATAALIAITGLAGYIPARRATRVDPMIALRYDQEKQAEDLVV